MTSVEISVFHYVPLQWRSRDSETEDGLSLKVKDQNQKQLIHYEFFPSRRSP